MPNERNEMTKNRLQQPNIIRITSLSLVVFLTPPAMLVASAEQDQAKLECSVVKQAKSDCLTLNLGCMECNVVSFVGVGTSWVCGCYPPAPAQFISPLNYEKHTYTICRQHNSDTCEDDKTCIYCVKTICGKWPKPNAIIPPGTGDMDHNYYECGWRMDIMGTMGFSVDCCYGKGIEDIF